MKSIAKYSPFIVLLILVIGVTVSLAQTQSPQTRLHRPRLRRPRLRRPHLPRPRLHRPGCK